MKQLLEEAARRAIAYLEHVDKRAVPPSPAAVAKLATLNQPLPEQATSPDKVLQMLDETCSAATMAISGRRV
ncbi:MAG: aspartate aminotransferase family protein, partial [Gammaproteobacteria bacterium]|nr:aspartate aminotransferase family protein [Gammaproteobacteria bacterium]